MNYAGPDGHLPPRGNAHGEHGCYQLLRLSLHQGNGVRGRWHHALDGTVYEQLRRRLPIRMRRCRATSEGRTSCARTRAGVVFHLRCTPAMTFTGPNGLLNVIAGVQASANGSAADDRVEPVHAQNQLPAAPVTSKKILFCEYPHVLPLLICEHHHMLGRFCSCRET